MKHNNGCIFEFVKNLQTNRVSVMLNKNDDNEIFEIKIRFPSTEFNINEETMDSIVITIRNRSNKLLSVRTNFLDFNNGILDINVSNKNHNYNPKKVLKTLKFLIEEIVPRLSLYKNLQ